MNDEKQNQMNEGETLRQFHDRILATYPEEKIRPAVAFLREKLGPEAEDIRILIKNRPDDWCAPHHFFFGMQVRNALRTAGFGEDYWPIWNLDDIYVPLIEQAVRN